MGPRGRWDNTFREAETGFVIPLSRRNLPRAGGTSSVVFGLEIKATSRDRPDGRGLPDI
jgi:hypothetical protein